MRCGIELRTDFEQLSSRIRENSGFVGTAVGSLTTSATKASHCQGFRRFPVARDTESADEIVHRSSTAAINDNARG